MFQTWSKNIQDNVVLVEKNVGSDLAIIVSGSQSDQAYWQEHLECTSRDVFRQDGSTLVVSVHEKHLKGNFLGTFNGWSEAGPAIAARGAGLPKVSLMSMVFGKGKRLSPFTQALGNRKPNFPTPRKGQLSGQFLRTVDLANLYTNTWLHHLADGGFRGIVVKWGDEAVIPGLDWNSRARDYSEVDAVRFVWQTDITPDLAREKEWVVIDAQTGRMVYQLSRQPLESLQRRVSQLGPGAKVGVNLGSLAITYDFMDTALEVLRDDILDPRRWGDWDPYVWIALCCREESDWRAEAEREIAIGKTGIRDLEARYPDFYPKIAQLRARLESKTGRPLAIAVLDFGETFWMDLGLHLTLRRTLNAMTADSNQGKATRELLNIPHERDRCGNILVRSAIPEGTEIVGSVIVDSTIHDPDSVIHGGVVVGSRHGKVSMPKGGCSLFCAVDNLSFRGPHGVAFRSLGSEVTIPEGGRHTSLLLAQGPEAMVANESILDYGGDTYSTPILGNRISFEEAGRIISAIEGQELEHRWLQAWSRE